MEQKAVEYKFADESKYHWNSCCLKVDKRALTFFTQATFSALTVGFCIVMLISDVFTLLSMINTSQRGLAALTPAQRVVMTVCFVLFPMVLVLFRRVLPL